MFIRVNGVYYSIAHIRSYRNEWKKNGKEYEKNGSSFELDDGTTVNATHHLEIEDCQIEPTIIPALEGYEIIGHCYNDATKETEYWFEPIIAWRIGGDWITPISIHTSWEDYDRSTYLAFHKKSDSRVYTRGCCYDSLEVYKDDVKEKGQ